MLRARVNTMRLIKISAFYVERVFSDNQSLYSVNHSIAVAYKERLRCTSFRTAAGLIDKTRVQCKYLHDICRINHKYALEHIFTPQEIVQFQIAQFCFPSAVNQIRFFFKRQKQNKNSLRPSSAVIEMQTMSRS